MYVPRPVTNELVRIKYYVRQYDAEEPQEQAWQKLRHKRIL